MTVVVAALYKFVSLEDYQNIQVPLRDLCATNGIRGSLLLSHEGINGTVAGSREAIDQLNLFFQADPRFHNLEYKESWAPIMPFNRLKVLLKKEIVTLGQPHVNPHKAVGTYLSPEEWNKLLEDPEVVLLDTRNDYEVEIGTFKGAIDPRTKTFREFPEFVKRHFDPKKHKKVAMFCTGGIRCEKASSYMLNEGFQEVYHLKGGILKYLEEVPQEKSLWEGECFVFDQRVSVGHGLELGHYYVCHGCRRPLEEGALQSPQYEQGVSCPKCFSETSETQKTRFRERHRQVLMGMKIGESRKAMKSPPVQELS